MKLSYLMVMAFVFAAPAVASGTVSGSSGATEGKAVLAVSDETLPGTAQGNVPTAMTNVYGRDYTLLNGKWNVIVDLYDQGRKMEVYRNRKPQKPEEFYEYSFDGGMRLNVPGDWNSQYPELMYYEGTVWYARHFDAVQEPGKRMFLYFGAVSYRCNVYLNGDLIASHEGGFTPFQVEVTGHLRPQDNFLCVEVNNRRTADAIPALAFDWWNYGGITRDVMLVTVPEVYVSDYFIQLDKHRPDVIHASVTLSDAVSREVRLDIPELGISRDLVTDGKGQASVSFKAKKLQRWSPDCPKLYDVSISCSGDSISERIGFRNIEVDGTRILVNGEPTFMRCISFHEEIPQRMGRAFGMADAQMLLSEAEALGVNMITGDTGMAGDKFQRCRYSGQGRKDAYGNDNEGQEQVCGRLLGCGQRDQAVPGAQCLPYIAS